MATMPVKAQNNDKTEEKDTIAFFRGVAVSVDLVGPLMKTIGEYGQYEAQLRINLKDKYFPVFEAGYGMGTHDEDVNTGIGAKTKAPFFRIGCDYNVSKNKHDDYRMYVGVRYGFTTYNFEMTHPGVEDPVWGGTVPYGVDSERCNFHWLEGVFGVDAKIVSNFRLGWSIRYRRKLAAKQSSIGDTWYVPGFGKCGKACWGGTFNLIFEL